ncbi:MAG: nuclear transport factor 2 family protein [Actinomycetota bacterium]|nr:nuclear transport factor 2 family protein [Actinomycetota bacterium]
MDLQDVIDELSIRRLVDTFCDGVNSRDADLWSSVWADDGAEFRLGENDIVGKDAIVAGFKSGIVAYDLLVQVATNGRIEITGDTATGRWYMLEITSLAGGADSQHLGLCRDEYTRSADGWRLQRREVERIYKGTAALDGWTRPVV